MPRAIDAGMQRKAVCGHNTAVILPYTSGLSLFSMAAKRDDHRTLVASGSITVPEVASARDVAGRCWSGDADMTSLPAFLTSLTMNPTHLLPFAAALAGVDNVAGTSFSQNND